MSNCAFLFGQEHRFSNTPHTPESSTQADFISLLSSPVPIAPKQCNVPVALTRSSQSLRSHQVHAHADIASRCLFYCHPARLGKVLVVPGMQHYANHACSELPDTEIITTAQARQPQPR
jgi:hypothetical protein